MADHANPQGMAGGADEMRQIHAALREWHTRLRLQQSLDWAPRGLALGLVVAVLLALAARVRPFLLRGTLIQLAALLALAGALAALLVVWAWPRAPLALARRFDRLFGLKERLSTAVEVSAGALRVDSAQLAAAQREDAAAAVERVDVRRQLPLHAGWRDWALAGAALLLFASAVILPNPQDEILAEQAEVREIVAEQLETLEALREEALEDPALSEDQRVEVVEALDGAIETLSQRDVTREEAFAALDEAERDLQALRQQAAEERGEGLQSAADAFRRAGAAEVAERLAEGDVQGAVDALGETLDELSAEELEALAESLQATDAELAEALREAAEALRQGDAGAARAAMERAGARLAEAAEPGEARLGEYAERVEEGQAAVAQAGQPGEGQAGEGQAGEGQMGQARTGQQGQGDQQGGQGEGGAEGTGPEAGQLTGDRPRGGGAPDGGEREAQVYAPQRIGGEGGEQIDLPGDPEGVPVQEGELADNPAGEASVPYSEVYGEYSESVNEALESGYVPLGMRGLIQKYFSRLDPAE